MSQSITEGKHLQPCERRIGLTSSQCMGNLERGKLS